MDGVLVCCSDIYGLMEHSQLQLHPELWRFFIDSSKVILKAVLLHNGKMRRAVPLAHTVPTKETCASI
jgi:hypothetical protein